MVKRKEEFDLTFDDLSDKSETIKRFIEERQRRFDYADVGHYVCLCFSTHAQSQAFIEHVLSIGIDVLYDRHINGEELAEHFNVKIPQCNLKPDKNPFNKRLAEMVDVKALKKGSSELKKKATKLK